MPVVFGGKKMYSYFAIGGVEVSAEGKVWYAIVSWKPIAIAGGLMLLSDTKKMICIDIRAKQSVANS